MKEKIYKNYDLIVFIILLILAMFVRIYKLVDIPSGIHCDEAGMFYDAFCLANFHCDRYLNHLPVYFINFGGGQSVMYGYLSAVLIKIIGMNYYAMRLPAVLLNVISFVVLFMTLRKNVGKNSSLLITFMYMFIPINIMNSRWGFDCNLMSPLVIISMCCLMNSKKWYEYIITGFIIGMTLYTYAISYVVVPIFLGITIIYLLISKNICVKNIFIMGITIFIIALPLILTQLVNMNIVDEIHSFITIPKLTKYRNNEFSFKNIYNNLLNIKAIFSDDGLPYNTVPKYGTIYYFAIPFSIMGIIISVVKAIRSFKDREKTINTIILSYFISLFFVGLLLNEWNANRLNSVYFPLIWFEYLTIKEIFEWVKYNFIKEKAVIINHIYLGLFLIVFSINASSFLNYYFVNYPIEHRVMPLCDKDIIDCINYIKNSDKTKNKYVNYIGISQEVYIYCLLADLPSPYDINLCIDNPSNINKIGTYYIGVYDIDDTHVYIIDPNADGYRKVLEDNGFKYDKVGENFIYYFE